MISIDGTLVTPGKPGPADRQVQGYRVWQPQKSKFAALWHAGIGRDRIELTNETRILYLGAGNGSTASFFADYCEVVYAVEFAPWPMRDLLLLALERNNIIPIMADARNPALYLPMVEPVDYLYMDVAQPDQAGIAIANRIFLRDSGILILILKTRSVSAGDSPGVIVGRTITRLSEHFLILADRLLEPYYPDHAGIICIKR